MAVYPNLIPRALMTNQFLGDKLGTIISFFSLPLFHCPAQMTELRVTLHTCLSLSSWFTGAAVLWGNRAPSCEAAAGLELTHSTSQQALASPGLAMQHPHPYPCPTVPHPRQAHLLSPDWLEGTVLNPETALCSWKRAVFN